MSTGNGTDPHYAEAARLAHTIGRRLPLSASERAQQRDAYIAAVDGMATVLREQVKAHDALLVRTDALERFVATLVNERESRAFSFLARLRWLFLGR